MKKWILLSFVLGALVQPRAFAANHSSSPSPGGDTGVGIILGEPTGFTAKFWQSHSTAIDAGIAYSFGSFVLFYGDYLWHFDLTSKEDFVRHLSPYLGVGGVFILSSKSSRTDDKFFTGNGDSAGLGARFPFGVEWLPGNPPLGVFLELVPGMGVVPKVFGFFEGGIGVRYYF